MVPSKVYGILFIIWVFGIGAAAGQLRQQTCTALVKELNAVLHSTPGLHWQHTGVMQVDSAFALKPNGELSVTVRYYTGNSFYRVRMCAQIQHVRTVQDQVYLLLEFNENVVYVFRSPLNSEDLFLLEKTDLMYVGKGIQVDRRKTEIQQLVQKLREAEAF
jgi:hypothetical protein